MPIDRIRSYALVLGVFTLLTTGCNNTLRKRDSLNGVYALTGEISGGRDERKNRRNHHYAKMTR